MKFVIFGLTVSTSWGNGHATLWRGLIRALTARGHRVVFYERDLPFYAPHRDLLDLAGGGLVIYPDWRTVREHARRELDDCDVAISTSYCPDGIAAAELLCSSRARLKVFYDLDTPVTLRGLDAGERVPYLPPQGLRDFDLVLSYTGGEALTQLRSRLGARRVAPLYGHVDPDVHRPVPPVAEYLADLSYLGTYAADRQRAVEMLLLQPARRRAASRFTIGGAQYPQDFPWTSNIFFVRHLPPSEHPAFFCSSRLTLNVTRRVMADLGYCPSGRLFEAAACGTAIVTDGWEGLESFYAPGEELLVAGGTSDVLAAMDRSDEELQRIARRARERTLDEHTSARRCDALERALQDAVTTPSAPASAARSAGMVS